MSSSSASDLTADLAGKFARLALGHVTRPYPFKLDQVLASDDPGGLPLVNLYDDVNGGQLVGSGTAFEPTFTGGVSVAMGEINGDGKAEGTWHVAKAQ